MVRKLAEQLDVDPDQLVELAGANSDLMGYVRGETQRLADALAVAYERVAVDVTAQGHAQGWLPAGLAVVFDPNHQQ